MNNTIPGIRRVFCFQETFLKIFVLAALTLGIDAPLPAQNPEFDWAASMGGTLGDIGYSMALDINGNVYITGSFSGTADFDPGAGTFNLSASGSSNSFICKLDASGNFVWAINTGAGNFSISKSITVDNDGYVYTTGYFDGTVDFDPGPGVYNLTSSASGNVFISKYDASDSLVWAKAITCSYFAQGFSIKTDASKNVYSTGSFNDSADFDPGPSSFSLTSFGGVDVFVSKLDSAGEFIWAKQIGGTDGEIPYSLSLDASENIIVAGEFSGAADFDPGPSTYNMAPVGWYDIFITKLDASGNFIWAKQIGGSSLDRTFSLAIGPEESIFLTGTFQEVCDFDPSPLTYFLAGVQYQDVYVVKLDSSGNLEWAKSFGGEDYDNGMSISPDSAGNVYVAGSFESTVDFDPGPAQYELTSSGDRDIFISKLDAEGEFKWAIGMGSTNDDVAMTVTNDPTGNVYATGLFHNTVDFDFSAATFNLTAPSSQTNIFVEKISQLAVGLSQNSFDDQGISPNPSSYFITLTYSVNIPSTLIITDAYGRIRKQFLLTLSSHSQVIETSNLVSGLYFVTISNEEERVSGELIIAR